MALFKELVYHLYCDRCDWETISEDEDLVSSPENDAIIIQFESFGYSKHDPTKLLCADCLAKEEGTLF